jgi:methyl-accepting chemotaxis protein
MRSAEAAKSTAAMIEQSVNNAKHGVAISTEVATMLQEITGAATRVNGLIGEIAAASNEQAQGIGQVSTAVAQMDKVTQSNAANAEESASASEELSSQAEQMAGVVRELVELVGGAIANTGAGQSSRGVATSRLVKKPSITVAAGQPRASTAKTRVPPAKLTKTVTLSETPAAVFPLDDNEAQQQQATQGQDDFSDFSAKQAA